MTAINKFSSEKEKLIRGAIKVTYTSETGGMKLFSVPSRPILIESYAGRSCLLSKIMNKKSIVQGVPKVLRESKFASFYYLLKQIGYFYIIW